jgi:hypothetical protein
MSLKRLLWGLIGGTALLTSLVTVSGCMPYNNGGGGEAAEPIP